MRVARHLERSWQRSKVGILHGSTWPLAYAQHPDAGVSLMLDQAMTLALPKAPAAVLERIASDDGPSSFSVTAICSGAAFLDDEPKKKVLAWYERTERSLIELQDVSLDAKRVKCLSELRKGHRSYSARKAADQ
jgi:hypothetical protein